ncbi:DUF6268 family outer membrane beta-barrel protein [Allomuricauda sp. d1]|uniref:DUF6268 family outer membrane beta-barrel protein n=1 Tax=Allomuricauda sp. d1 TaxID=3136725 RepID=UPI0031D508F5
MLRCRHVLACTSLIFLAMDGFAQSSDVLRIDYLRIPKNASGIETSRYKFLLNIPIKLNEDNYLVAGAEYNQFDVGYSVELPFDNSELDTFHIVDFNLGHITKWNENWRLITVVTPRLASNFVKSPDGDDFFFNATATFLKDVPEGDKPFRLVLGLSFNSTTGLPFPLPLVSYYKRFHPKWSYTLGIPRTNFRYHLTEKQFLQASVLLDGYFINIQNDIALPDGRTGSRISLSALVAALGYQYRIAKRTSFYVLMGHTIEQEGILRNDKRDNVFTLNRDGNFYLRGGFKISIF